MKPTSLLLTLGLVACSAVALAEPIQKWRTPDGSLFFGDHPPPGSTLVATYPDTASPPITVIPGEVASLAQAAADGRDIIRRREEERAADRRADQERDARQAELEAQAAYDDGAPFWFITSTVSPCRFGDSCFHPHRGHHRRFHDADRGPFNHTGGYYTPGVPSNGFRPSPPPPRRMVMQAPEPPSRRGMIR